MDPLNTPAKCEIRSFTHSSDNRGYPKKFGQSLDTPTLPFLQNVSWAFVLLLFWPYLKFIALPVPEITAIGVFGGVGTLSSGRRGQRGSGMVPFERAKVSTEFL